MPVISISGLPCCGSTTIGKLLAEKLKIEFFSVGAYYKSHGKGTNETEKAINFLGSKEGTSRPLNNSVDDMQIDLAKKGNIVIDSKAGIYFLKELTDLKVWLHAPFETRVERVAKRESCSLEKAKLLLESKEKLEKELFQKVYNFNYLTQREQADIVIDVSSISPEDATEIIAKKLKKSQ